MDWGGTATPVGKAALALTERLFDAWYAARDDPARRAALVRTVAPIQAEFRALFEAELTIAATCKQQHRDLLDYLTSVCTAAQRGQAIPLLLPAAPLTRVA